MGLVDFVSVAPIYFNLCTYKKYLLRKALEFFVLLCVKLSANESRGFGSFFCIRFFEATRRNRETVTAGSPQH